MKVVRTLEVSPEEFFDALLSKIELEISDVEGAPVERQVGAGTTYLARDGVGTPSVKTTIKVCDRPRRVVVEAKKGRDHARTEYLIRPSSDGTAEQPKCIVEFLQEATTFDRALGSKRGIRRSMTELSYLRRMCDGLYALQRTALDARSGVKPARPSRFSGASLPKGIRRLLGA